MIFSYNALCQSFPVSIFLTCNLLTTSDHSLQMGCFSNDATSTMLACSLQQINFVSTIQDENTIGLIGYIIYLFLLIGYIIYSFYLFLYFFLLGSLDWCYCMGECEEYKCSIMANFDFFLLPGLAILQYYEYTTTTKNNKNKKERKKEKRRASQQNHCTIIREWREKGLEN